MSLSREQIDARMERLTETCHRHGLRLTRQRVEVFREIARTEAHPGAETILQRVRERMPNISFDTVYRTLGSLEVMGLVSKVSALHGSARFDANTAPHCHFVCMRCGVVRDVSGPSPADFGSTAELGRLGRADSFHAEIRGVCRACLGQRS